MSTPKLGGKISKEQMIALLLTDFMTWTSDRERNGTSWMLSLEEWAQRQYNLAYEAEKAAAASSGILPAAPSAGGVGA